MSHAIGDGSLRSSVRRGGIRCIVWSATDDYRFTVGFRANIFELADFNSVYNRIPREPRLQYAYILYTFFACELHPKCMQIRIHLEWSLHTIFIHFVCSFGMHFCMRIASEIHANSNAYMHAKMHPKCMKIHMHFAWRLHTICIEFAIYVRCEWTTHWGRVRVHILANNDAFGNRFSLQSTCLCMYFFIYVVESVFT